MTEVTLLSGMTHRKRDMISALCVHDVLLAACLIQFTFRDVYVLLYFSNTG